MDDKFDSEIIDNEEGRKFIVNVVDFFVNASMEETEILRNWQTERVKDKTKLLYKNYKFIRDTINISVAPEDIYYVLIRHAAKYIDFIEDGHNPNRLFPAHILSRFELNSWFNNNIDRYYTEEMIITLANKLFNSIYRYIFV